MAIKQTNILQYRIDYICDSCHAGMMIAQNFPPRETGINHICDSCSIEQVLDIAYPYITFADSIE